MSRPEMIRQMQSYASPTVQNSADSWTAEYRLPLAFLGFQGHFPDYPVLPAMLQFAMVRLLIEEALGEPCVLDIRSAKFSSPIHPDAVIAVHVSRGAPVWKAKVSVKQAGAESFETAATLSVIPQKLEFASHEV